MSRNLFIACLFIGTLISWALSNDHVLDAFGTLIAITLMIVAVLLTALMGWVWWNVRAGDPESDAQNDATRKQYTHGK